MVHFFVTDFSTRPDGKNGQRTQRQGAAAVVDQDEYLRQQAQSLRELARVMKRPDLRDRMLELVADLERIAADVQRGHTPN